MARNEALAIEIQEELKKLEIQQRHLMEELEAANPARAEESALKRQTVSITDIDFLGVVDKGRQGKEYRKHVVRILKDIEASPFRRKSSGKLVLEERKLTIEVSFMPHSSIDRDQLDGVRISDLELKFKIKSQLPNYESDPSMAAITQTPDGLYADVRVHPDNPDNPRQLCFPDTDD